MPGPLKLFGVVLLLAALLVTLVVVREAFWGHGTWYFIVPNARLTVDGRPSEGWLHVRTYDRGRVMFVTRRSDGKVESYLTTLEKGEKGYVWPCGDWTAPDFPFFPIGDVNPPCTFFTVAEEEPSQPKPKAVNRELRVGPGFVEFTADDGKRVRASW